MSSFPSRYVRQLLILSCAAVCCLGRSAQADSAESEAGLAPVGDESKYLSNIRQVTNEGMGLFNAGEGYFSPDGKMIIFQATPIGKEEYQIYTLDLATSKLRMVSTGKGACTCAYFHPKGDKIIFASTHLDPNVDKPKTSEESEGYQWFFEEHMDIFEAEIDGNGLKRLTDTPGYDAEGTYSPDGSMIIFTSKRDGDLEIYVMDADGSNQRRLTYGKGYDGGPFFSRDGKTILYRGDRRNDGKMNLQLRMVDISGKNDRAITDNPIFNWCPFWHPSGKSWIFTQVDHEGWSRGQKPNYDLFMMAAGSTKQVRISHHPEFDGLPVFDAKGKRLLWTSKRNGLSESQLFIADFTPPGELVK